jgi:hypothetical protein
LHSSRAIVCNEQVWKGVRSGEHWHSKDVYHTTTRWALLNKCDSRSVWLLDQSCINLNAGLRCDLHHSCANVIPGNCCVRMSSNDRNSWIPLLWNNGFQPWCCEKRDRHGQAHKVFFVRVTA